MSDKPSDQETPENNRLAELERELADQREKLRRLEDRLVRPRSIGRQTIWTATPERCFIKCLLKHIVTDDFVGQAIVVELRRLVPFLSELFDPMPTDRAFIARAYWGSKPGPGGSVSEWPEVHPKTRPFWEAAKAVYDRRTPMTREEMAHIAVHKSLPDTVVSIEEQPDAAAPVHEPESEGAVEASPSSAPHLPTGGRDETGA